LEKPAISPSLWNLFRENNLSGISRNRAGGIRTHKFRLRDRLIARGNSGGETFEFTVDH